jgi:glycosyltransferase involved in cell wall biosynthesis
MRTARASYQRGRLADRPDWSFAIVRTAFVSTYPPRRCGIATFTHELASVTGNREVVALHPPEPASPYPIEVHHRIRRDERGEYVRTARDLSACVDVVSIQHEYGIWGGDDGAYVLDFVRSLDIPAVATLHTIMRRPTGAQRAILTELVSRVDATVVMSRSAATLLESVYGVDASRVEIIPHGVPDLPLVRPETIKAAVDLQGQNVILSFGLLGPGKGYELAVEALPAVVAEHPNTTYVIVGATHPDLLKREGEAYRNGLTARVKALRMNDHVRFIDRFVGRNELLRWLEAADVFVTPYPNLDQIVSGTLSYAMGAGRAVVSTPYAYATEQLAEGRGVLFTPGSPVALANALNELLGDDELRANVGRRGYEYTRRMVWSEVGAGYGRLFERIAAGPRTSIGIAPMAVVNA